MVFDSIASIHAPSSPKDFGRKKRTNRSAKLKQYKLDARREQWLSQVNGKEKGKPGGENGGIRVLPTHMHNENHPLGNLEMSPSREESDGSIRHWSGPESPSNSPISSNSLLSSKNSGMNFYGSSSNSGGSCSGNVSEEDEDDGCFDDWEAVADALAIKEQKQRSSSDISTEDHRPVHLDPPPQLPERPALGVGHSKQECGVRFPRAQTCSQAWRSNDALRPHCLPNLSKQRSFPLNPDCHYSHGPISWACKSIMSAPMSCPICYEDLDSTDSSFLPCSCGFRLCLFCHKRILEEDGRCPGCRKQYHHDPVEWEPSLNGVSLTFQLTRSRSRSRSLITRS